MNWIFLVLGLACLAYYLICGFGVRFNQSMLWVWPVAAFFLLLRFTIVQISIVRGVPLPFPAWLVVAFRCAAAAAFAFFLVVEGFVLSGCFSRCPPGADYLVILGAKTGSKALEHRIDAAAQYLLDNPETIAIASGGQGADEEMAEGDYIAQGLAARGIDVSRILIENRSLSTSQNMLYSRELIDDADASVAIVSNDFHIARARCLARKVFSRDVSAISVRSSAISFPHYVVREFFTTVVDTIRGNMAF